MDLNLRGKRGVVLAASRGLGFASALGLAREGVDLVICSRDQGRIEQAAQQIRAETGVRVIPQSLNVAQPEAVQGLVNTCVERLGGLEIAVHNAGGPPAGGFESVQIEQWQQAIDQNLMSFVHLVKAVVPEMRKSGYGRILAITSSSIKQPIPNLVLSNGLRTGILGVAKTLSKELGPDQILVNVIAPGRILTERTQELDRAVAQRTGQTPEQVQQQAIDRIPVGRLGRPEELANLVTFLASEAASYITGTAIQVDGGVIDALQ